MAEMDKPFRLQALGWCLAVLSLGAGPAAAVETAAELEATREAMRTLEREQRQRLGEIERLEGRAEAVARRSQALRVDQRKLAAAVAEQEAMVAERQREVALREAELSAAREQAGQLLYGQWLRARHHGWPPRGDAPLARHRPVLDARIQAHREEALAQIAQQVRTLSQARDRLAEARDELMAQETQARRTLREIARQEDQLAGLLVQVQQQVQSDTLEMERLARNAETLEQVLRRMEARAEAVAAEAARDRAATGAATGFAARRGSLQLPVDGPFLHRYGNPRGSGVHALWRGEVFATADDAPVRAVSLGRTVYADWMRGYGFVVILDHGDDYLTLYGNAKELLTRQGDAVAAGDVIARAGSTHTGIAPGLYFELRHQGQTLNPQPWWNSK